jgi:hypothetical protein
VRLAPIVPCLVVASSYDLWTWRSLPGLAVTWPRRASWARRPTKSSRQTSVKAGTSARLTPHHAHRGPDAKILRVIRDKALRPTGRRYPHYLDHPGNLGGSDTWEDSGPWRHSGSIRTSCVNAR